jgi:poly-gamma-glutamate capsule biosynthesis protein CapA/YwtB (metallophosphatase superfamily)
VLLQRRASALFGCALVVVLATACSSSPDVVASNTGASADAGPADGSGAPTTETTTPAKQAVKSGRVRIAFGGDVHFEGSSAAGLNGDLGTAMSMLKKADIGVVNLETAITARGTAAPKQYTFRAPATGLTALRKAGIDVVTLANNHGMDYGRVGLADTLAAGKRAGLPIIGAGKDVTAAFTPYRRTVNGVRVSVLGATDVLDSFAITTWPATATSSGLASAKEPNLLVDAVRLAATRSDVVVVVLHWGTETVSCPSQRQQTLARRLTRAGADVVVGSHAHVLEPYVRQGRTAIHYGLGNFVFYASGGPGAQSGVYSVVVDSKGVVGSKWSPAVIQAGRPQLLTGSAAEAAASKEARLAGSCGLG